MRLPISAELLYRICRAFEDMQRQGFNLRETWHPQPEPSLIGVY
jgi:hypothetical protein